MKAAAIEAAKNLAMYEKQQVNLEERKKHASTKATKLKKSLKEVRAWLRSFPFVLTNRGRFEGSKI